MWIYRLPGPDAFRILDREPDVLAADGFMSAAVGGHERLVAQDVDQTRNAMAFFIEFGNSAWHEKPAAISRFGQTVPQIGIESPPVYRRRIITEGKAPPELAEKRD